MFVIGLLIHAPDFEYWHEVGWLLYYLLLPSFGIGGSIFHKTRFLNIYLVITGLILTWVELPIEDRFISFTTFVLTSCQTQLILAGHAKPKRVKKSLD